MFEIRRPSIRLSPRRHDAGAALMIKFRPKDGSTVRNRRLRSVDVLRAMLLPILCFAIAFAIKEHRGVSWMKPSVLAGQPASSTAVTKPGLASRIAPDSPLDTRVTVRLTHIEDLADDALITLPVSLSREIRVAEEDAPIEAPAEAKATEPSLRAALNLGDQPMRAVHR
jgi:hypothetical protein